MQKLYMDKAALLIACAWVIALATRAQVTPLELQMEERVVFGYGFKGGISLSAPDVDEWSNQAVPNMAIHDRVGVQFGVVGMLPLNRFWAVRTELNYSSQGYKESISNQGQFAERQVQQQYLQSPILVQFVLSRGVCMYTGLKAGYMVGNTNGFKRGDLAWDIGLSTLNTWNWGFDVRYSSGLVNIAPDYHPAMARAKNKVLQAGVIYMFTQKK